MHFDCVRQIYLSTGTFFVSHNSSALMQLSVPLSHYVAHLAYILLGAFVTDVRLQNLFVFKEKGSRGNNETEIKAHIVLDEDCGMKFESCFGLVSEALLI